MSQPPGDLLARHTEQFANFARHVFGSSPLYARLSAGVADDPDMVALTLPMQPGQPAPIFLFAVVRYLVLAHGADARVAYLLEPSRLGPGEDPYPAFRAFCLEHSDEVLAQITTRRVQTNEVRRSATLLPAFAVACTVAGGRPLALIEMGASAGLNLLWERYHYDYGAESWGDPASGVRLTCEVHSAARPTMPPPTVEIASRIGIDLDPVDIDDADDITWLRALIWPEQADRLQLLDAALAMARADPPRVVQADVLDALPALFRQAPAGCLPVFYHSFAAYQLTEESRAQLKAILRDAGASREIVRISLEGGRGEPGSILQAAIYGPSGTRRARLAVCDHHGIWIDWVEGAPVWS